MPQEKHTLTTTFLAIPLSEEVRERLTKVQKKLVKKKYPVVWERPEKLHITFLYLGRIDHQQTASMVQVLKAVSVGTKPFIAKVGYLSYFYKKHATGIVWVGVDSSGELEKLHKRLVRQLNEQDFSLSEKKLTAHITIGRLKKVRNRQQLRLLDNLADQDIAGIEDLGELLVDEIVVFSSRYQREINTTEFQILTRVRLGG